MDLLAVCRLYKTYQSESSEAEDININLLLNQCTDRDATLVQLSTLRLIFESSSYSKLHRTAVDNPLLSDLLAAGLSSGDTLVCFCCCKVLVAMFVTPDLTCKQQNLWIEFALSHSVSEVSNYWQGSVYCLQSLAEVLKLLRRKKLHSEANSGDLCCSCMKYLHMWWPKITECLLVSDTAILVKLTLLSIAVETFRHSLLVDSELCGDRQLCLSIFRVLPRVISSIKLWTPCALLVLYEVVTILYKVLEDKSVLDEVYDAFTELLYCCIHTNQLVFDDIALKDVVTRKLLLSLLKYTAVTLEGVVDIAKLGHLGRLICELVKSSPDMHHAQQTIFEHLREQDDSLIEGLAAACRIHWSLLNLPAEIKKTAVDHLGIINIHTFMLQFFSSTSFDHSILLDFVMSGESNLEPLLVKYLEIGVADWHGLKAVCAQADVDGTREQNFCSVCTLDSFMGTLLKFKYRLLRLCSKGLFPYPVKDMLAALEKLEELYENNTIMINNY